MTQKKILLATIVIIACMGIFPPWHIKTKSGGHKDMGYWWITSPPQHTIWQGQRPIDSEINFNTLLLQWIIVGLVGGGLYIYKKE